MENRNNEAYNKGFEEGREEKRRMEEKGKEATKGYSQKETEEIIETLKEQADEERREGKESSQEKHEWSEEDYVKWIEEQAGKKQEEREIDPEKARGVGEKSVEGYEEYKNYLKKKESEGPVSGDSESLKIKIKIRIIERNPVFQEAVKSGDDRKMEELEALGKEIVEKRRELDEKMRSYEERIEEIKQKYGKEGAGSQSESGKKLEKEQKRLERIIEVGIEIERGGKVVDCLADPEDYFEGQREEGILEVEDDLGEDEEGGEEKGDGGDGIGPLGDEKTREALVKKLKEYEERGDDENTLYKREILRNYLNGETDKLKIAQRVQREFLANEGKYSSENFNNAYEVIKDYVETGGKNTFGGTGLNIEKEQVEGKSIEDANDLVEKLQELNPGIRIELGDTGKIYSAKALEELMLPDGFDYNEKNGLTNKHNTESSSYIAVQVELMDKERGKSEKGDERPKGIINGAIERIGKWFKDKIG